MDVRLGQRDDKLKQEPKRKKERGQGNNSGVHRGIRKEGGRSDENNTLGREREGEIVLSISTA